MDWWNIFVQAVGFGGAACLIGAYQCRTAHGFFAVQMGGQLLYILHFAMLGALAGTWSLVVLLLRGIVLFNAKKQWARSSLMLPTLVILFGVVGIVTWTGPICLLPAVAGIVSTVAMWSANGKKIRLAALFCTCPFWFVYDFVSGSWSGVVCEIFTASSILLSIMRYGMSALDVDEAINRKQ